MSENTQTTAATCPAALAVTDTATAERARDHRGLALVALLVGAFLPPLDYFIVNLALPAIRSGLHASAAELQLIVSAYASAYAVFLITGGRLGDLYGRKRIFMLGMGGFVLSSLLCGFASSGAMLIGGRILKGLSASMLAPQVLATIRTVFPQQQQTRIMGIYGFVFGLAAVIGQLGGGALITLHPFGLDWRAIFLVNLPIGIAALLGTWRYIPENRPAHGASVDIPGVILLSACLWLIIYPLTHGREQGWPAWTMLSLAASVPTLALFLWVERRHLRMGRDPLLDLRLFRHPAFAIGLLLAFLFYCDSVFFLTYGVYLQDGLHWTPLTAGFAIMPFALGFIVGPLASPRLAQHIHSHVLTVGFALLTIGFSVVAMQAGRSALPGLPFYAGLLVAGLGHGLVQPSVVRIALAEVRPEQAGTASGVVLATLQIGAAVGAAAISGIFFSVLGQHPAQVDYALAFRASLRVLSGLLAACIGFSLLLRWLQHRRAA